MAKRYRVWWNGREVSENCFYADPRRGVVRLFSRLDDGMFRLNANGDGVITEERRGRVVVRKMAA
jgi:hypothetical protein